MLHARTLSFTIMPLKKSAKKVVAAKSSRSQENSKNAITPINDTIPQNVRNYWENLAWTDISEHFDDRTTERGRRYGEGGNVESLWATSDGRTLLAIVQGTQEYKTRVTLENGRKKGAFTIDTTCSCPVGSDCKHGVATITKFLDLFAKNTPIPPCTELEGDTWETFSQDGKRNVLKIDFDEFDEDEDDFWDDDDEDDWDEDEEDYDPAPKRRKSKADPVKSTPKKDDPIETLKNKLKSKSHDAVIDIVLALYHEYGDVREHFKQEAFAESLSKTSDLDKLVDKAIQLIDKGFKGAAASYDYNCYDRHHGSSGPDLDSVGKVVKQFKRFEDPLPAIDRVTRHLIEKGCQYVEQSGAEDTDEIDSVFYDMVEVLLASKSTPVGIILWSHDISYLGDYDIGGYAVRKIREHDWPAKVWSGVADAMLGQMRDKKAESRWGLRVIVETLDKANRQKEATDLLRKEAKSSLEQKLFADRLINSGLLDEAEKLVLQQQAEALKNNERHHYHDNWVGRLKTIAEKRKDWASLASFQAAEFFEIPSRKSIEPLIKSAKKLKVEPIVRQAVQEFLRTGEYPEFITKSLFGEKLTPTVKKAWPIPFFTFQTDKRKPEPSLDLLCEWAIDENRPKDVLHWFDECAKQKSKRRDPSLREVADAIAEMFPDRAFRIYRDQAEHEMEATRNYPEAIRILRKAQKALEKAGRSAEWPKIMEEIRATHRRKSSLMKQLNELTAGSIVKQKMSGKR